MAKPKNCKNQIFKLRDTGLSYDKIAENLNCSATTVRYHLNSKFREKIKSKKKQLREQHPYYSKLESFRIKKYNFKLKKSNKNDVKAIVYYKLRTFLVSPKLKGKSHKMKNKITLQDVINKFGENPKCYLTGQAIDIMKPATYHFDHIIPVAKGGENTIDNMQIALTDANYAKRDMLLNDFIELCKQVTINAGYSINKINNQ